jgi:hypothetical protein
MREIFFDMSDAPAKSVQAIIPMVRDELQRRMNELGLWFHSLDFGDWGCAATRIPEEVEGIFETRLEMTRRVLCAVYK